MQRRGFLAGAAVTAALPAGRALAQTSATRLLRYVPQADLTVIDPVMTTAYITRYHALMVWDQLYGIDSQYRPQPQMVAGHTLEDDGKLWTFTWRDGLHFHDGEPVRGRDCVASIKRWATRPDGPGTDGARRPRWGRPRRPAVHHPALPPFSLVLDALAKSGPPALVVMPERLASTDPYQPIKRSSAVARSTSSPGERVVGSLVAYARNTDYQPREGGQPDWLAGPKIVNFDRVEWRRDAGSRHRRRGARERRGGLVGEPAQRSAADAGWQPQRADGGHRPAAGEHGRAQPPCIRRSTRWRCAACCWRRPRRPT